MTVGGVPLALAFAAGLVATVNPCGFALLPSFISYYLGAGSPQDDRPGHVSDGLVVGLVLTAGFLLVFASVGLVFSLGARAVLRFLPWVTVVIGLVLMVLGLWLLAGRHLALRLPGLRHGSGGAGYRSIFAFGVAYGVGSLSCTLPIFLVVIGAGLAQGSASGILGVFAAYGLGMATVLMLLCLATAGFRDVLIRRTRLVMPYMSRISGGLLVLSGAYVAYYWLSLLSGNAESGPVRFMQTLQDDAQNLITRVGERAWFAVGVALFFAAAIVLVGRRMRDRVPEDEEPSTEVGELEEETLDASASGSRSEL
ncbi:MAG: cytochrome c biogenesis protein CcdA [Actinobacteria bacterium]|nr:cytochrome c biogenesis protein CcdA [Actinomycetota bacterium]